MKTPSAEPTPLAPEPAALPPEIPEPSHSQKMREAGFTRRPSPPGKMAGNLWRDVMTEDQLMKLLSGMFIDTTNMENQAWGFHHAKGWNDALRRVMDYIGGGIGDPERSGSAVQRAADEDRAEAERWRLTEDEMWNAAVEMCAKACDAEALADPQPSTSDEAYEQAVKDCADAVRRLYIRTTPAASGNQAEARSDGKEQTEGL